MKKLIKFLICRSSAGRVLASCFSLRKQLIKAGWVRSKESGLPVAEDGTPLPWYTYPAIHFLSGRICNHWEVFEYGSGNSTLWWATRVKSVTTCEHHEEWYQKLRPRLPVNVQYLFRPLETDGEYAKSVLSTGKQYDVIIIDGRDRVNCAKYALGSLNPEGIIVWDNSDRDKYAEGYRHLCNAGFKRLDFEGMGPVNITDWCTSIFYRDNNACNI